MPVRPGPSSVRRAAACVALALLVACGGGGGGGGGGGAATTGDVAGTIVVPGVVWGMLAEREPNGTPSRAQVLPPLEPDGTLKVAGDGSADGSRTGLVDATDAFRVVTPVGVDVVVTLLAQSGGVAQSAFDLAALDAGTGLPIASSATASNPEVVSFSLAAGAAADLVVTCASGAGAWTLTIETTTAVPARIATTRTGWSPSDAPSEAATDYALDDPDLVPGRLLLRVRGGRAEAEAAAASVGGALRRRTASGTWVVDVPSLRAQGPRASLAGCARLGLHESVVRVEPDAVVRPCAVPDDPRLGAQWPLSAIGAPSAWDVSFGSSSVVVGVIDTGVVAHPDLDAQRVGGYDFVDDAATAGDGDGRDPDPTDEGARDGEGGTSSWHGSHVAGIAVARAGNGYGVAGVAPGCRFMPLRATGVGGGSTSDLADAILYAAGLAATDDGPALAAPLRVVNMSLGLGVDVAEIRDAVQAAAGAGVLLVASAGNTGGAVLYPAAYPEVLAVGAVDGRLVHAAYSCVGTELDLVAPGGGADGRDTEADGFHDGVLSTVLDETVAPAVPSFGYESGTSMASPHVAGAAALLLSVEPSLTAAQARAALLATCRDLDVAGPDTLTGAGLLAVGEAVRKVLADRGTPRADPARLLLSSTSLRVASDASTGFVYVSNAGGGTLTVDTIAVQTDTGVPWLGAFATLAAPGSPATVDRVVVVVDRTGLASGAYAGTVFVRNGATVLGALRVVAEVGPAPDLGAEVPVVLRRTSNGAVVASTTARPENGYRYVFAGVAAGDYTVLAGTDRDDDGFFCEAGDLCGSHGAFTVVAGERTTGVDVVLGP